MHRVNSNLVAITGGPGTGKTAILQELERRGFVASRAEFILEHVLV